MHANDAIADDSHGRQAVEDVDEASAPNSSARGDQVKTPGSLERLDSITPLALVKEPISHRHARALMISSQDEEIVRVLDFEREHQAKDFNVLPPSIDIVAQKKIIALGWEPPMPKKSQEVVKLTMDITTDTNGRFEFDE